MRVFLKRTMLVVGVLLLSASLTWSRHVPGHIEKKPPQAPPPTVGPPRQPPTIKRLGVWRPVTGGYDAPGLVELDRPAPPGGVLIHVTSSNPAVATVGKAAVNVATVKVEGGTTTEQFRVSTSPVTTPTSVTISAQIRGSGGVVPSTLTVNPPTLTLLNCEPNSVPGGTSATCRVGLTGPVALKASVEVALASSNPSVATVPPKVTVPSKLQTASFQAKAQPLPQSAPVTIFASYAGLTKTTEVRVLPVSIRFAHCTAIYQGPPSGPGAPACEIVPGQSTSSGALPMLFGIVGLTAPAPPGGVRIRLSSSGGELILLYPGPGGGPYLPFPQDIVVPEEKTQEIFMLVPSSVWVDTKVIISAYAPLTNDSRTATVTIRPPSLTSVRFGQLPAPSTQDPPTISSVPLGGKRILMWVRVDGYAPKGGLPVSLQYSGTTDVAGPSQVIVPDRARGHSFEVTVYPCGVNPPCRVVITARYRGSMVTATLTVNP